MLGGIPLFYLFFFRRRTSTPPPTFSELTLLEGIPTSLRQAIRPWALHILLALFVSALCIGAARPQRILLSESDKHRNIVLTVDVSQSMEALDISQNFTHISRMDAVKSVLREFVKTRSEDRIGLVVFGGKAFLQSPLTNDHQFILTLLEGLQPGMAGDGTAIGDGLGVSLKRIRELPAETRAIILVTDGANNAGRIDPEACASIAKSLGIKIHTIGIGGDPQENSPGGIFDLLVPQAEFDEALLKNISKTTGGIYFNAGSINKLREIYSTLDALMTAELKDDPKKIVYEYYPYAASIALFSLALLLWLSRTVFKRIGGAFL